MNRFCILLVYYILQCGVIAEADNYKDNSKRLLLNDPDAFLARLTEVEKEIAKLKSENVRVTEVEKDIAKLKSENVRLQQTVQNSHGSTYVRWGRKSCSGPQTELVYTGYAAGQRFYHLGSKSHFGGPTNTLCLPDNPQLSNDTFSLEDVCLYGSEYQKNTFAYNSADEDVPCAVCRSTIASTALMIPGRQSCYNGWSLEYSGSLAAGSDYYSPSSFICVDSKPEYIPSGQKNEDGHLIYKVAIKCGPLPCPPYHDNRAVPCVVCSK